MNDTPANTEQHIESWIQDQGVMPTYRPYVWPGSWPDRDLRDMALALPGWQYDSAWIWYESWDPEIPGAVAEFNHRHPSLRAHVLRRDNAWHPPRDLIVVMSRDSADLMQIMMWLTLGETYAGPNHRSAR